MFSGIIEATSPVISSAMGGRCRRVAIRVPRGWRLSIGESVNVDGICSTVVERGPERFQVDYMPETLSKTTAGSLTRGSRVNLERSLRWRGRISGHFVAGHVDARGSVTAAERAGRARTIIVAIPSSLQAYVVPRGSIAINGVSLTIARVRRGRIVVALIPHTLSATNLGKLEKGDMVNVECDLLAKYARGGTVRRHAKKRTRKKA